MNESLWEFNGTLLGYPLDIVITGWKLIGYLGVIIFSARWLVQMYASRKAGRPVMTRTFWLMSMAGSLMVLSYFMFSSKRDGVGILSNLFPAFVALYNLYLDCRYHRENGQGPGPEAPQKEANPERKESTENQIGKDDAARKRVSEEAPTTVK